MLKKLLYFYLALTLFFLTLPNDGVQENWITISGMSVLLAEITDLFVKELKTIWTDLHD